MFDRKLLATALDLQERSYRLLCWLGDGMDRKSVGFETVHHATTSAEAARAWLEEHFERLPIRGRPSSRTGPEMIQFANLLASYIETSFDLVEEPGNRWKTNCGCLCAFCLVAVQAPHLRPKSLRQTDKHRARELECRSVERIAHERGFPVSRAVIEDLLRARCQREQAAMVAYALELQRRCEGLCEGPSVLALWRTFAWKPTGSPRPDFQLTASDILEAELSLARELERIRIGRAR